MSPSKRYAQKQAKARQRRRRHAHERLERDRRQAQRAAEALHQAIEAPGLPADLVAEIEGRWGTPRTHGTPLCQYQRVFAAPNT
jgi:hypothetical protein